MKKKVLSILLALVMMFSLIPTTMWAEESESVAEVNGTGYATLADAIAAANDGDTVTLLSNVTLTGTQKIAKNLTIDGNNKTVTAPEGNAAGKVYYVFSVVDEGGSAISVTLKDMTLNTTGYQVAVMANGDYNSTVNVNNVDITTDGAAIYANGHMTVQATGCGIVRSGMYTTGKDNAYYSALNVGYGGTLEATDCNITVNGGNGAASFPSGGTFTLTNVNITVAQDDGSGLAAGYALWSRNEDYTNYPDYCMDSVINVTSGTINGDLFLTDKYPEGNAKNVYEPKISATGGTFTSDPTAYVAEGYEAVDNNDGTWTVSAVKVAEVNGVKYTTLADAIAAANASGNCTITILQDVDFSSEDLVGYKWAGSTFNPLRISATGVTLDLNEHRFYNMGNCAIEFGSIFSKDGTIASAAITNGTLEAGKTNGATNSYVLLLGGVDNVTISNITTNGGINACAGTNATISDCVVNGTKYYTVCAQTGSHVAINGTTFTKNTKAMDNTVATNAMFWVQGAGTDEDCITDGNPTGAFGASSITLFGGTYSANPTAYVADGYEAVDNNDGTWTVSSIKVAQIGNVKYETLEAAIAAAQPGDTIEMLDNVVVNTGAANSRLAISKSMTIDGNGYTILINNRGFGVGMNATSSIDVTFKDVTILNNTVAGRCIDTRGNIGTLILDNATLSTVGAAKTGYDQPLTIGGNQSTPATVIIRNGSEIKTSEDGTAYYAIITFNPVNMTITDSTIKGWACIYAKGVDGSAGSAGSVFTINNSTLVSKNIYNGSTNAFSMFKFEDNNVEVNITNSVLDVSATGDQNQAIGGSAKNSGLSDIEVNLGEGNVVTMTGLAKFANNEAAVNITGGKFDKDPSAYVAEGYEAADNTDDDAAAYPFVVTEAAPVDVYTAAAAAATGTLSLGGTGNTFRFTIIKNGTKLTTTAEYSAEKANWELVYDPAYIELTKTAASGSGIGYTVKALKAGTTTITFRNIADPTITASTVLTNKHAVSITYDRSADVSNGNKYLLEKGTLTITKITFDGVAYTGAELDTFLASHTLTAEGNATIDGLNVTPSATGNVYIHVTDKEDDTVTARSGLLNFINAVAQIGNDYYATLTKAFAAAQNGDTITLISDITEKVNFGGTAPRATEFALTLDLNGHTFTAPANENFALRVQYGVITIKDSVGTGAIRYGKNSAILVDHLAGDYPSKVIIESGTFTGKSTVVQTGYPGGSGANYKYYGGELEVLGGTFVTVADTNENYDANGNFRYTLNMLDMNPSAYAGGIYSPSSITVKGGIFNGFDPANNAAEGENTNFVAEGYESVKVNSDTWQVGEVKASAIAAQETVAENYEATYTANKKVVDENDVALAQDTSITVNLKADDNEVSAGNVLNNQYDVSTIVAAIVEAEGAKASTLNVSITVVKDNPGVVEENNKKTVTYEVHPVATITNENGDTLGTYTISNDQLAGGATFVIKLPVPEALQTNGYVKVTHKLSDGSTVVYDSLAYDNDGFITIADVAEFSEFELEIAETVTASASYGFTLALKNKIEIPLYVYNLTDDAYNYFVEYSYTDADGLYVHNTVCLSDYSIGNGWYRFVVAEFSARQMSDEVYVRLYNNGGDIYNGYYSIKQYCEYMIGGGTQTESLIKLCKAALDYGKAAQLYFDYNLSSPIADSYNFLNSGVTIGSEHASSLSSSMFNFVGATVSLKSQVQVNFYFRGGYYGGYTFKVNGEQVQPLEQGGYYVVSVSGITAKDLGKPVTVTVTSYGEEETFSYSPLAYAYYIQQNSQNNELIDVCKAMYLYWSAANDYLN